MSSPISSDHVRGDRVVRGLRWSWVRHDTPAAAPSVDVVFIHGFQNDHTAWDPLVASIGREGRRLTLLDLPGCGQSEAPTTWQRSTIDELALDVAQIVRDLEMREPVLVGHSLGGAIALQVAIDEPELLSGLVLFAPASTTGLDFVPAEAADALAHPAPDDQRRLLRAAFHRPPDDERLAALEAVVLRAHPLHIEGAARSMRDFVVEPRLAEITAPAVVVAGDRDRHVPLRHHLATWTHLRRAGLHVEHDVGHVPFAEAASASAAVVDHFIDHERRRPDGAPPDR
jgi:sigma-B regulation protein RsbQ